MVRNNKKFVFSDITPSRFKKGTTNIKVFILAQVDPKLPGLEVLIKRMGEIKRYKSKREIKFRDFYEYYSNAFTRSQKEEINNIIKKSTIIIVDIREAEKELEETLRKIHHNLSINLCLKAMNKEVKRETYNILKREILYIASPLEQISNIINILHDSFLFLNSGEIFSHPSPIQIVNSVLKRLDNKFQNVLYFIAQFNSIYWKVKNKKIRKDLQKDIHSIIKKNILGIFPQNLRYFNRLFNRIFERGYIFDRGNERSFTVLEEIHKDVGEIHQQIKKYLVPPEIENIYEVIERNSQEYIELQVADIAAGFARKIFDIKDKEGVKRFFDRVIYNGRILLDEE